MSDADPRTTEDLQREKLMLEIEKLRADLLTQRERFEQDKLAQDKRLRREGWQLVFFAVGGAATFLAAAATFGKLFFGG